MPANLEKEPLYIVMCGHVDSGKSTTTGCLLFELGGIPERELDKLEQDEERLKKSSCVWSTRPRSRRIWFQARRACPKQWQRRVESTANPLAQSRAGPKQSAQTPKSNSVSRSCMCGWRSCAVWRRRRGWHQNTWCLGEQRGEERTSAIGGACTALSSEAVQEHRGQGRLDAYRVLPGPGGVRNFGPRHMRPFRARSIEAPHTDAREVERLAHRVEQHSLHMAGSCVAGYWSRRWCMLSS